MRSEFLNTSLGFAERIINAISFFRLQRSSTTEKDYNLENDNALISNSIRRQRYFAGEMTTSKLAPAASLFSGIYLNHRRFATQVG